MAPEEAGKDHRNSVRVSTRLKRRADGNRSFPRENYEKAARVVAQSRYGGSSEAAAAEERAKSAPIIIDLTLDDYDNPSPRVPSRRFQPTFRSSIATAGEQNVIDLTGDVFDLVPQLEDAKSDVKRESPKQPASTPLIERRSPIYLAINESEMAEVSNKRKAFARNIGNGPMQLPERTSRNSATAGKSGRTRTGGSGVTSSPVPRNRRTTIEDSTVAEDGDVEMEDDASSLPSLPPEQVVQYAPLPAFMPVPAQSKTFKKFVDWTQPNIALDYQDISAVWQRYVEDCKEDHVRYVTDKLERERLRHQKAHRQWIKEQSILDETTKDTQTDPNWYNAPAVSSLASGEAGEGTFSFICRPCQKIARSEKLHVDMTPFRCEARAIPYYRTYYPVRKNQLVQSDDNLLFWPEATETKNMPEHKIKRKLAEWYNLRMSSRSGETAYSQLGARWQPYCEAFLEDLNLSEEDMMRFLIDPSHDAEIKLQFANLQMNKKEESPILLLEDMREQLEAAPQATAITLRLSHLEQEEKGFEELKSLKFKYLALAFIAVSSCYRYSMDMPCFNIIYCLAESPSLDMAALLEGPGHNEEQELIYSAATHFDLACRVCHIYPCFVHGLDSMWDYRLDTPKEHNDDGGGGDDNNDANKYENDEKDSPLLDVFKTLHRRLLSRKPVQAPRPIAKRPSRDIEFEDESLYGDIKTNKENKMIKAVFFPCNHQGPCKVGVCHCIPGLCEKSCGCDSSCKNRFKGCKCARKGKACGFRCPCVRAERECDPDLCGTCGVYDVLDPQNRNEDPSFFEDKCQNCKIQQNVSKRTWIGKSTKYGIGLFAGEDIKRGEFIGEYTGAKLTWKHAERSGLYHQLGNYSYLFDMTNDQTVDSMVLGNKTRFINSIKNKTNLDAKVRVCNTEHRMALWASKNIKAGQELSFDYGDEFFKNHEENGTDTPKAQRLNAGGAPTSAVVVKKYSRKPYGQRGPYKKATKRNDSLSSSMVGSVDKGNARATHKNMIKDVRPSKEIAGRVSKMKGLLQEQELDEEAEEGEDMSDVEMEDLDSIVGSTDEDFEDEDSDEEVAESSEEESIATRPGTSSSRILMRRRGGQR